MNPMKILDTAAASVANLVPAITGLTGNLAIASAGAIIAPIIQTGITEMVHQVLGKLQRKKVIVSANITCQSIVNTLNSGIPLRQDNFFEFKDSPILGEKESSASKLFEGSLLKAKEEYDSKKIPYISFLTTNIFFAPNITEAQAIALLEILSKLSYRQLCILALFNKYKTLPLGSYQAGVRVVKSLYHLCDLIYDITALNREMLIETTVAGQSLGHTDYQISELGSLLYETANLKDLPQQDLQDIKSKFDYIQSFRKDKK